jgi:NADH-quinone oxidoreductase subunit N
VIAALHVVSGLSAREGDIASPSIDYKALSPFIVVFGVALAGVLVEAFVPKQFRRNVQIFLALGGLAGAFAAVVALHTRRSIVAAGAVAVDGPALFLEGTLLLLAFGSVLLLAERSTDSTGGALVADPAALPGTTYARNLLLSQDTVTEVYPLLTFSVGGMMLFAASNTLLVMFIALEILSLPLYLMAGLARRRRLLSQEAAMKYFLLGAFASAFFIYGLAMIYGYAGSVNLGAIHDAVQTTGKNDTYLFLGMGLLAIGLLFKIGAVPFHSWTPDVYQGSPTPVTAFMAACTKVAAFGALLRTFYVAFGDSRWDWRPFMWGVAILTMIVGAIFAITQRDVKRMLAYSSIAHAGFILVGVTATNRDGLAACLFYLAVYGFTTLGAFAIVGLVRDGADEANDLSRWAGLGKRAPFIAGSFAFFLLALTGIPLTSGFIGKFAVFSAAVSGHAVALVVVAVITSAVTGFFYARVIVLMFFTDPAPDGPTVALPSAYTAIVLALGLSVTLVLGVVPSSVLDLAHDAAQFVR